MVSLILFRLIKIGPQKPPDMKVVLKTFPISTNHLYAQRGSQRFLRPEVRANKEAMAWEARAQFRGEPLVGLLAVRVDVFLPTKRRFDVDNIKGLLDALTGVVWLDDSLITDLRITKTLDVARPRVELWVSAL